MAKNNDLILSCMLAHIIVNNYDIGLGMRENKPFYKYIYIYIYIYIPQIHIKLV